VTKDPTQVKGVQILDEVASKAIDQEEYRRELLGDPKAVLRREGLHVRDETEVVVVENTPERIYLVLPSDVIDIELDIDEVELELIIPLNKF
jgi:hypothetical protein